MKNVICHYEKVCAASAKFTEAQIAFALRQSETGTRVEEICRQLGVSQATFFNWRKKYGGMSYF